MADLAYRSFASNLDSSLTSSTAVGTKPTGTVTDDGMTCFLVTYNLAPTAAPDVSSPPSGWVQEGADVTGTLNGGAVNVRVQPWTKVAGASEGASYSWTLAATAGWATEMVTLDNPLTSDFGQTSSGGTGTSTSPSSPSITLDKSAQGLLWYSLSDNSGVTYTPPSGMTEHVDSNGVSIALQVGIAAGASGARTGTISSSAGWISCMVALYSEDSTAGGGISIPVVYHHRQRNF